MSHEVEGWVRVTHVKFTFQHYLALVRLSRRRETTAAAVVAARSRRPPTEVTACPLAAAAAAFRPQPCAATPATLPVTIAAFAELGGV